MIARFRGLIEPDVLQETRRPASAEDFLHTTAPGPVDVSQPGDSDDPPEDGGTEGRATRLSLRAFAEQRRAYLLEHPELRGP